MHPGTNTESHGVERLRGLLAPTRETQPFHGGARGALIGQRQILLTVPSVSRAGGSRRDLHHLPQDAILEDPFSEGKVLVDTPTR